MLRLGIGLCPFVQGPIQTKMEKFVQFIAPCSKCLQNNIDDLFFIKNKYFERIKCEAVVHIHIDQWLPTIAPSCSSGWEYGRLHQIFCLHRIFLDLPTFLF